MLKALTPFHQQAEDIGTFLASDRARDLELSRGQEDTKGPSENAD
jgi:hypothetical protein